MSKRNITALVLRMARTRPRLSNADRSRLIAAGYAKQLEFYDKLVAEYAAAVRKQAGKIGGLLAKLNKSNLAARYKIACEVAKLDDATRYGPNAIGHAAKIIGCPRGTLHDYASVGRAYIRKEFAELAALRGPRQGRTKWAHLVITSRFPSGHAERVRWVLNVLERRANNHGRPGG